MKLYENPNSSGDPNIAEEIASTYTDDNGNYLFDNLNPGTYFVLLLASNIVMGALLEGYRSSNGQFGLEAGPYEPGPDPDNPTDDDDNGTILLNGDIASVAVTLPGTHTVTAGQMPLTHVNANLRVDFGLFLPARLGSLVWFDTDGDGVHDVGEAGVPGIVVTLYDAAGNPILDVNGNPVTVTTGSDGQFLFTNLAPESYQIGFSNLPAGYTFTSRDKGGDDTIDSDADPNTGRTGFVTVVPG